MQKKTPQREKRGPLLPRPPEREASAPDDRADDDMAPSRAAVGGPTKASATVFGDIVAALRVGAFASTAATAAGISERTMCRWRASGREDPSGPYGEFGAACDQAEARGELERIRRIEAAGLSGDWKADAWHLERRHHERWKLRESREVDVGGDALEAIAAALSSAYASVQDDESGDP